MDNNSRLKVGDIVQHFKREFLRGSWVDSSSKYLYKIIGFATFRNKRKVSCLSGII